MHNVSKAQQVYFFSFRKCSESLLHRRSKTKSKAVEMVFIIKMNASCDK